MSTRVLTDNAVETLSIKWDEERFALIHESKEFSVYVAPIKIIILNPVEAKTLVSFILKFIKGGIDG